MNFNKAHTLLISLPNLQGFQNLVGFKKIILPSCLWLDRFLILNFSFLIGFSQTLDQQTYNYISGTNQLSYVYDAAAIDASTIDIDDQTSSTSTNYAYDAKGQLTKDEAEGILSFS